ncbi:hypothetical protein HID58_081839 [Brassica napus]|uniref:Protein arginine methyltransferase NDUFAF7 n=1 Tax=Brassica napus TaxID=3708 RepID=A0ABQ7YBI2_BRANA|nr:hypothetical protein HID58_081839 [Brassica napus]
MSSAAESTKKPYDSLIDSVFSVSSSSKLPTAFLLSFRICSSLQSSLRSENHKLSHSQDGGEEAGPTRNKRERTAIPHRRSIDTISLPDNQTSSTNLQSSLRSENHKLSHSQDGGEEAGPTRNKRERIAIPHHRSIDTISLPDNQTSPTNPALQKLQHQDLKCTDESSSEKKAISSLAGTPVHWHATLEEAPSGGMHVCYIYLLRLSYEALGLISNSQRLPTIIIAHEFYDALPVHQFQVCVICNIVFSFKFSMCILNGLTLQKSPRGWCEKMVDVEEDSQFRFVLSPQPTPAALYLVKRCT